MNLSITCECGSYVSLDFENTVSGEFLVSLLTAWTDRHPHTSKLEPFTDSAEPQVSQDQPAKHEHQRETSRDGG